MVVTSLRVSARFRILIRNVAAKSEGLERREAEASWPLTVHDTHLDTDQRVDKFETRQNNRFPSIANRERIR